MKFVDGSARLSASDLSNFLACRHLTRLDGAAARGERRAPAAYDLGFQKLIERGAAHEAGILRQFRADGLEVVEIDYADRHDRGAAQATRDAIVSGVPVIAQAVLLGGGEGTPNLLGIADFLVRPDIVAGGSGHHAAGYEVVDAKLARTAKARAVLQIAFYSALLADVQGHAPASMHLALGNTRYASFRCADFAAYERRMRQLLTDAVAAGATYGLAETYPEPIEHCAICRWSADCDRQRRDDDDLSLVAGMPTTQRVALKQAGTATRRGFAGLAELPRLGRRSPSSLARAQLQARLQVESEDAGTIRYELLDPEVDQEGAFVPNRGLLALPEPAVGDLFFDIEGARYYSEDAEEFGLQYLFGIVDTARSAGGQPAYTQLWAFDRRDEKRAFQELIDFTAERRAANPGLHVYHYNHYETTSVEHLSTLHGTHEEAVGHLMGRFATREDDVDDLFRLGVFVDLYRVVTQAVRAGVEGYSIKRLEPLIGYQRAIPLRDATAHLIGFEDELEAGTARESTESRAVIAGYNEDDCRATLVLRDWLEARRQELAERTGMALPRPEFHEAAHETEDPEVAALRLALTSDIPEEPDDQGELDRARLLLADLLDWHRRENKPGWWRYFTCCRLSSEDLVHESDAIGELSGGEVVDQVSRSVVRRFSHPAQEHGFKVGEKAYDPVGKKSWTVVAVDQQHGTIDLKIGASNTAPLPTHLVESGPLQAPLLAASLRQLAERVVHEGLETLRTTCASASLLLRDAPRGEALATAPLRRRGEPLDKAAPRIILGLDRSYLAIQGPPGTGKTYLGAMAILAAVKAKKTVGVTALSYAVIHNLLDEVVTLANKAAVEVPRMAQKVQQEDTPWLHERARSMSYEAIREGLATHELDLAAGTVWMWARDDYEHAVDILFVDEAGQLSLANTLAASRGAHNVVLLGDPQQLAQPRQGSHPPGAGTSALEHVLGHHSTMPDEQGLFLDHTYRMHPDLCAFTSEAFYEGRLSGVPGLERQVVYGLSEVPAGAGLCVLEVPHTGDTNASPEEAREVARLAGELLGCQWTDQHGVEAPLTPEDVLVVTPYNAQVGEIERALASATVDGVRVGTVDKFQGREAPAVIYSMASSSAEDAPRGMEFLFDLHRLNVATSRARSIGIIVASPDLSRAFCRTPHQMRLANALCSAWQR